LKQDDDSIEVIDLSAPLISLNSPVYPGTPQPVRGTFLTVEESGFSSNLWTLEEHTGTHVDAPAHVLSKSPSIDKIPLSRYVGRGIVLDFSRHRSKSIGERDILKRLEKEGMNRKLATGSVILFYTGHTRKFGTPAWMNAPGLNRKGCEFLGKLGVKAIGFDAASPDHAPFPAHKLLLPRGIGLYENLANLEKVLHKTFIFVGAPLPLVGGTASPVRAFALILRRPENINSSRPC
jgi:kynurenine formamidase